MVCFLRSLLWCLARPWFGECAYLWRTGWACRACVKPLPWSVLSRFCHCFWRYWWCLPCATVLVKAGFLDAAITVVVQHDVIARLSTEVNFVCDVCRFLSVMYVVWRVVNSVPLCCGSGRSLPRWCKSLASSQVAYWTSACNLFRFVCLCEVWVICILVLQRTSTGLSLLSWEQSTAVVDTSRSHWVPLVELLTA